MVALVIGRLQAVIASICSLPGFLTGEQWSFYFYQHLCFGRVRQISGSLPPVGRELLFKVPCGWSPSATV